MAAKKPAARKRAPKKKPAARESADKKKSDEAQSTTTQPTVQAQSGHPTTATQAATQEPTTSSGPGDSKNELSDQDERGEQVTKQGPDPAQGTGSAEAGDQPSVEEKFREIEPYRPWRLPLKHAGFDQHAAEAERQAELAAAREEHTRRTGDASR